MRARAAIALWGALVAASFAVAAAIPARADRTSPRTVRYDLDARLDAERHVVEGKGTILWRSDAQVPVSTLRFHLYLNAFRDENSTFFKGATSRGEKRRRKDAFDPANPGGIEVTALSVAGGADLLPTWRFLSPDDGNPDDRTVAEVALPTPVEPGGEIRLEVQWKARLPKIVARSGFGGDFHMVVQWFPKLGVWEDVGEGGATAAGWNCHQYHASSEFFADYGVYHVRLTVPPEYEGKVGASGKQVGEAGRNPDGTFTYTFHADDVHDFAWVVGARFVVKTDVFEGRFGTDGDAREAAKVARILGRSVTDLALPPVEVRFLLAPEHEDQYDRHRRAIAHALTYMGLWFGPYPYPTLTVVDPLPPGGRAGGMEYPTLITGGTSYRIAEKGLDPEFVLVHEFGHQHFYGLLGSNEFEDAWVDEGFTTYATARVLEIAYGPRALSTIRWWCGFPVEREPVFEFPGLLAGLRRTIPALGDEWLPFGRLGVVRAIGDAFGGVAPDTIAAWPAATETTPVAFLRDLPHLTHPEWPPHTVPDHERVRFAQDGPDTDALAGRCAWQYLDGKAYGNHTYRRTANLLRTLEGLLGEETMLRILRTYAERYRFKHPTPDDFWRTATEVSRWDLGWFTDGLTRGTPVLDFGVHAIDVGERDAKGLVESVVTLRRYGDATFPIPVEVRFEDGSIRGLRWDLNDLVTAQDGGPPVETVAAPPAPSQYRWVKLRFLGPSPVAAATTDPRRTVGLEDDRTNDGRRVTADSRASTGLSIRVLGWVQQITTFYGGL